MNLLIKYIIEESKVLSEAPVLSFLLIVLGFIIAKLFYKETVKHVLEQRKNDKEKLKEEKKKVDILINELEEKDNIIRTGEFSSLFKKNNLNTYRDREEPYSSPLPHHRTYGSVYGGSADQAESDPGEHKSE